MVEQNKVTWMLGGEEIVWSPSPSKVKSQRVNATETIPRQVQTTLRPRLCRQSHLPKQESSKHSASDETTTYETLSGGIQWMVAFLRTLFSEATD